jgi:hypothetical protein
MPTVVGVKLRFSTKPQYYEVTDPAPEADAKPDEAPPAALIRAWPSSNSPWMDRP